MQCFKRLRPLITLSVLLTWMASAQGQTNWQIDNTNSIGGVATTAIGNPTPVESPFGTAMHFDGNDGLIVDTLPVAGAQSFTMEMLLRPDANPNATLDQPRILHLQSTAPNDHRAILEGRIQGNQWYLDGFLRAPNASNPNTIGSLALIDPAKVHPVDQWYSYALVYDGAELRVYLNGELELSGAIEVLPLAAGQTSIGMRHNQVNFFSGDIAKVRFTNSALAPEALLAARIPGDFNGDYYAAGGGIDDRDLAIWKSQYGQFGLPAPHGGNSGDADQDGDVDGHDFLLWQRAAGASATTDVNAVPEPSSGWLIAPWLVIAGHNRCRRKCSGC